MDHFFIPMYFNKQNTKPNPKHNKKNIKRISLANIGYVQRIKKLFKKNNSPPIMENINLRSAFSESSMLDSPNNSGIELTKLESFEDNIEEKINDKVTKSLHYIDTNGQLLEQEFKDNPSITSLDQFLLYLKSQMENKNINKKKLVKILSSLSTSLSNLKLTDQIQMLKKMYKITQDYKINKLSIKFYNEDTSTYRATHLTSLINLFNTSKVIGDIDNIMSNMHATFNNINEFVCINDPTLILPANNNIKALISIRIQDKNEITDLNLVLKNNDENEDYNRIFKKNKIYHTLKNIFYKNEIMKDIKIFLASISLNINFSFDSKNELYSFFKINFLEENTWLSTRNFRIGSYYQLCQGTSLLDKKQIIQLSENKKEHFKTQVLNEIQNSRQTHITTTDTVNE